MPNSTLDPDSRTVYEQTTVEYQFTLKDLAGVVIPAADLVTLTLTLYDVASGSIINSRDGQDVLNANNVTVSAGGVVVYTMLPADNAIVGTPAANAAETHGVQFRWTWGAAPPYKAGELLVEVYVVNRAKVS